MHTRVSNTLTLATLLTSLGANQIPAGATDIFVGKAVVDSRMAKPGDLFVALRGENTDGHAYVQAAFDHGASAALVEHATTSQSCLDLTDQQALPMAVSAPVEIVVADVLTALQQLAAAWRLRYKVTMIGVTGSVGKTTAKEIIATVLSQRHGTLRNPGNYNNEIGLPLTLLGLDRSHTCAVLEMGMYDLGEIALLASLAKPQIGVVMNVQPVHLERLGTLERIAQAKAELLQALPEDGLALLYGDDPLVLAMAAQTEARCTTFGLEPDNDLWADHIEPLGLEGVRFVAHLRGEPEPHHLQISMAGRHAVLPALAAIGIGRHIGLTWPEIKAGLLAAKGALRLTPKHGPHGALLLDDTYNASPSATLAALDLMRDLPGRRIALLGDMLELGDLEEQAHRQVGRACAKLLDLLITLGPRAQIIAQAAAKAGLSKDAIVILQDKEQAIQLLQNLLQAGDIALIKGSRSMGMEVIVDALEREERV